MSAPKFLFSTEAVGVVSVALGVAVGVYFGLRAHRRKRPTPEQLEELRRRWLSNYGKLGGGEILDVQDHSLSYLYEVRGISYTAFQDVTALASYLPGDRWSIIGGVGVRYDPRNPANSIVLGETWTGLRHQSRAAN